MENNMHAPVLTLKASVDRSLAWRGGDSVRYLVAEITTPVPDAKSQIVVRPLNLAIVIDASGSMSGDKLESAKQAAIGVVSALGERDRISIISFADDVIAHVDGMVPNADGQSRARHAIMAIQPRGSTNLSDGWFAGAESVSKGMETVAGTMNRVILLSDGQANRGIIDPAHLAEHATALRLRGVFTSTVGIGDDYTAPVLQAIAENGGGRMHDAETSGEIVEVILGELLETKLIAAENVTVEVQVPANVQATLVGSYPVNNDGVLSIMMGSLVGGRTATAVVRLKLPPGQEGDAMKFLVSARGYAPGTKDILETTRDEVKIRLSPGHENSGQVRNLHVTTTVARVWQSIITKTGAAMNRNGERRQARSYLERELKWFEQYCHEIPELTVLVKEVSLILQQIDRVWSERTRKEMEFSSYALRNSKLDLRAMPRRAWSERLMDEKDKL